ncbi:hypothetical protein KW462_13595, partial [Vibrio fluvialis]|nr:hypothetical protein [Vibrio fluvialis]
KGRRRAANAFRVGELTVSPLIGGHSKPPAMQVDFYFSFFKPITFGLPIRIIPRGLQHRGFLGSCIIAFLYALLFCAYFLAGCT